MQPAALAIQLVGMTPPCPVRGCRLRCSFCVWGDLPAWWVEVAPWVPKDESLVMFWCCLAGQPVAQALAGASCSAGLLGEGGLWGYRPVGRAVRAPRVCLVSWVLRDPLYSGGNAALAFQRHGTARCGVGLRPPRNQGWDPGRGIWPCRPAAWRLRVAPAAGGETELCGSRGVVHPPVIRIWVRERFARLAACVR